MPQDTASRYAEAYKPLVSAIPCFAGGIFFAGCYLQVLSATGPSVTLPTLGAIVYQIGGSLGLATVSALFILAFVVLTALGLKKRAALGEEIGSDAVDGVRLEKARESAKRNPISSRVPKHLESLDTFRAYNRRVRFMLVFFAVFFGLIILGVYFKVL